MLYRTAGALWIMGATDMRKPGRKIKMTIEQVAEAMELINKGVYMTNLAIIYGVSYDTLRKTIRHAELYGFALWDDQ